jgi:hypothetical protein
MNGAAINIEVPKSDVDALRDTLERYVESFSKGPREAVKKAAVYIVRSLRSSTKRSPEKRHVVRNPNRYDGTNTQSNRFALAHAHIMAWYESHGSSSKRKGVHQSWLPPLRHIMDRRAAAHYAVERYTQKRGKRYIGIPDALKDGGISEAKATAESRMPKVLNIMRRGTAKSSWGWMLARLGKTDSTEQPIIGGVTQVAELSSRDAISIELTNSLGYIRKATKANVSGVMGRANRAIIDEIQGHISRSSRPLPTSLRRPRMRAA